MLFKTKKIACLKSMTSYSSFHRHTTGLPSFKKQTHILPPQTHTRQVSFTFRTAEFLFKHLNRVGKESLKTGMHFKNLAIVWGPNVMR